MNDPKVTIPEEAFEAAAEHIRSHPAVTDEDAYDLASDAVRAAAPLILAVELERFAADYVESAEALGEPRMGTPASGMVTVLHDVAADLRARAAGLRGVSADGGTGSGLPGGTPR